MSIKHYKAVFGSPVMQLMPYAWCDLIENGYIDEYCRPFEYDEEAFVYTVGGQANSVVGFITFKDYAHVDYTNVIEVGIGWIKKDFRKKGYYALLYKALRKEAFKRKKEFIWSSVWDNNTTMIRHALSQGRKIRYIGIEDRLYTTDDMTVLPPKS